MLVVCLLLQIAIAEVPWTHLSTAAGQLPAPGGSSQQTGLLIGDFNRDGAQDFVISYRVHGPALVLYQVVRGQWKRSVIESEFLPLEAGGAAADIDQDGDLDIVFGEDSRGKRLFWWENPSWTRHAIKTSGANQHHDQIFGDFLGTGRAQLAFWNQRAKTLFLAPVPAEPRSGEWPLQTVFTGDAGEGRGYAEGIDAADVDGDGRLDLLAGNAWFRYRDGRFQATAIHATGGRIHAGRFAKGRNLQVVIAPGDQSGALRLFRCAGDATDPACWRGEDLLGQEMVHGHTLDVGDVDGDGKLDIFAAEMAKWTNGPKVDHPEAKAWILYGDGKGRFRKTVFTTGHGWHEGKLADVDGDGDLDVIGKPYTWNAPRVDVWLNGTRAGRR